MLNTATKPIVTSSDNATINDAERSVKKELDHAITLVRDAGRKVSDMLHSASDEISHVSEKTTAEIRSNPVRSSLIALGAGFLLSALIRR